MVDSPPLVASRAHVRLSLSGDPSKSLASLKSTPPPIYLPRADAMLIHRQMQLHQREHAHATAHGHIPIIPLPQPNVILEDTLLDFETTQKQGNIILTLFELLRRPKPSPMSQEAEILAAGYGLGQGRHGRGVEAVAAVGGGARAQQAAAAAAALAAAKSKQYAKEELRPLAISEHAKDDLTHAPPLPTGPKSFYHPPPPLTLLDAALPQTVIFDDGHIQSWYFSSVGDEQNPANTILKKKAVNCTTENVIKVFLETHASKKVTPWQSTRELDIVATFYPRSFSDVHQVVPLFLTRVQFDKFVRHRATKLRVSGVLQSFIAPKGTHNTLLRCEWTPATCKVLERIPGLPIENPKSKGKGYDIDSRLATFERNWQVALSSGALLVDDSWSESERRRHEEEYLDMMLNGGIFGESSGLTRKGGVQLEGVNATNTIQTVHAGINPHHAAKEAAAAAAAAAAAKDPSGSPSATAAAAAAAAAAAHSSFYEDTPKLVTTLAYNEHRMTQIECLDQDLVQNLNSYCWLVADHLRHTLTRHVRGAPNNSVDSAVPVLPIKLTLYFKVGAGNKLWLLFGDEFIASQGAPAIINKFHAQMNDPMRDHLLKLLTPPQEVKSHGGAPFGPSATREFVQNLPIISPTAKRAPFNARMDVKEWIRYKWSHWEGEYEWNRTLGLLDLHREAAREAAKLEATAAALNSINFKDIASAMTPPTPSAFKRIARESIDQAAAARRNAKRDANNFADVPPNERPGTTHQCSQCKSRFELGASTCLQDHKADIHSVLLHSVSSKFVPRKTAPSIWHTAVEDHFPGISEEMCKKRLRSKRWYEETKVILCDGCWEEVYGEPRVQPDQTAPDLTSLATLVLHSVDLLHSPPPPLKVRLTDSVLQGLDELLAEFLRLPVGSAVLLDDTPSARREEKEREIYEIQLQAAYSKANATSIAQGMGDVAQRLAAQRFKEAQEAAAAHPKAQPTPVSPPTYKKKSKQQLAADAAALDRQRQLRLDKLSAMAAAAAEELKNPAKILFPGIDGVPLTHATPHNESTAHAQAHATLTGEEEFLQKNAVARHHHHHHRPTDDDDDNLAAYHLQNLLDRAAQGPSHRAASSDGVSPNWKYLRNSKQREQEAQERVGRRLERTYRFEDERIAREAEERVRLESTKEDRQKWSTRFRQEWLAKLEQEAERRNAEREQQEHGDSVSSSRPPSAPLSPLFPFPLIAAAGSRPKFPTPAVVAQYVHAHGLPESYITAYEESWNTVLEPAMEKAKQHDKEMEERRKQKEASSASSLPAPTRHSRSESARTTLPRLDSASSHAYSSRSSRARGVVRGGLIEESIKASRRIYTSLSPVRPTSNIVAHTQPWNDVTLSSDPQLAHLAHTPSYDQALLPKDHANAFDLTRRPETNLNVYPRGRSPVRVGGGALRDGSPDRTRSITPTRQASRGSPSTSERVPLSVSILPYLSKSASTPVLGAGSAAATRTHPTTFGTEVGSPTRVTSDATRHGDSDGVAKPLSLPSAVKAAPQVYAMAVAEYLGSQHVGYAHGETLKPQAVYSSDKNRDPTGVGSSSLAPLPAVLEKSPAKRSATHARQPHTHTTPSRKKTLRNSPEEKDASSVRSPSTNGKAWNDNTTTLAPTQPLPPRPDRTPLHTLIMHAPKQTLTSKPAKKQVAPATASTLSTAPAATTTPVKQKDATSASPQTQQKHTRVSASPNATSKGAARSAKPVSSKKASHPPPSLQPASDSSSSSSSVPLLDGPGLAALHELHSGHRARGETCSCDDLLNIIHRHGSPSPTRAPNAARERLEAWLAEHEDPIATLASIHEEAEQSTAQREITDARLQLQFIFRDARNDLFPSLLHSAPDVWVDQLLRVLLDLGGSMPLVQRTLDRLRSVQATSPDLHDCEAILAAIAEQATSTHRVAELTEPALDEPPATDAEPEPSNEADANHAQQQTTNNEIHTDTEQTESKQGPESAQPINDDERTNQDESEQQSHPVDSSSSPPSSIPPALESATSAPLPPESPLAPPVDHTAPTVGLADQQTDQAQPEQMQTQPDTNNEP